MDENKEEIQKLRKQVRNLRIAFLLTQIGFLIISIIFQIQYCRMMHYYREIFQLNQEISQSLIDVNPSNTKITLGKTLSTLSEKTFSNEVTFEKSVLIINNNVEKVRETANGANDKSDMAISIAQSKDIEAITNLELDEICK